MTKELIQQISQFLPTYDCIRLRRASVQFKKTLNSFLPLRLQLEAEFINGFL